MLSSFDSYRVALSLVVLCVHEIKHPRKLPSFLKLETSNLIIYIISLLPFSTV